MAPLNCLIAAMYRYDFSVIQTIVVSCSYVQVGLQCGIACSYVQVGLQCDTDGGVAYSYVQVGLQLVAYSKSGWGRSGYGWGRGGPWM